MIVIKDVIKAIDTTIENNFTIKVTSTDIREKIIRPSFYVDIDTNKPKQFNANLKKNTLTVRIYYFPTSAYKNRIELLNVQEKLEELFYKGVAVTGTFFIPFVDENQMEFTTTDGVLQLTMDLYYIQEIEDNTEYEMLEELELNIDADN